MNFFKRNTFLISTLFFIHPITKGYATFLHTSNMPQQLRLPLLFGSTELVIQPEEHNRASLLLGNKEQVSLAVFSNVTASWNHSYCLRKLCFLSLQQFPSALSFNHVRVTVGEQGKVQQFILFGYENGNTNVKIL